MRWLAAGLRSLLGTVVFVLRNAQNCVTQSQRGLVDLPRLCAARARRRGPMLRWRAWKPGMPAADFSAQSRRDMLSYSKPRCDLRPLRAAFRATCADALRTDASTSGGTSVPLSSSACAPGPRRRPSAPSRPRRSRTWRSAAIDAGRAARSPPPRCGTCRTPGASDSRTGGPLPRRARLCARAPYPAAPIDGGRRK